MKIMVIGDTPGWAIGGLTRAIIRNNPQHTFLDLYVHPREVGPHVESVRQQLKDFDPDIVFLTYWRTAQQLIEAVPELKEKNTILSHQNQKNLLSCDWDALGIKRHIVHTQKSLDVLLDKGYEKVHLINYGIDLSFFTYAEKLPEKPMVGYCGRIVPWKGLKEIAVACQELGFTLKVMGKMDKRDYWESIPLEAKAVMDFEFLDCPDEDRAAFFHSLTLYVGNSGDNHEEGTLPLLEALACGIPVASTPSGIAADILDDGRNAVVVPFGDAAALKSAIARLAVPSEESEKIRREGWQTVKNLDERKMAWQHGSVFNAAKGKGDPLVSVILPTYNRKENVLRILESLKEQTWKHLEVIIADDGSDDGTEEQVALFKAANPGMTVRHLRTGQFIEREGIEPIHTGIKDYGLARARNAAVIDAQGEYLLFLDSRLLPDKDCIRAFISKLWVADTDRGKKVWAFGEKGSKKETFVENFSMVRRDLFIAGGMCCERIDRYGGMSQELRERFKRQGFAFEYLPSARAEAMEGSHTSPQKRQDIIESKLKLAKMGF